ncbi:hypothetical protein [Bizionia sp.]|uniref:hypothetical protein n=1 Tax=Bizionia sp. TaxID=1954480 RepID=UPI003A90135C
MKTIKTIMVLAALLLLTPCTTNAQEQESFIMNITEFTVKFGQDHNFTDGVKKWKKCYQDNNGTNKWNVWHRLQGKGNVYVVAGNMANWAEMSKEDPASKSCSAIALESITPFIESTDFNTTRFIPGISRNAPFGDATIIWVTNFIVHDDFTFNEIIPEVTTAIASKEGDKRGYWYRVMGGETSDYFVTTPFQDFAAMDVETDNVWKVFESVHGEKKTKETRKKFRESVEDIWSYTFMLESELSLK